VEFTFRAVNEAELPLVGAEAISSNSIQAS